MSRVKEHRLFLGYTQKEMASLLGISETQYRAKENKHYDFTQSEISKFYNEVKIKIPNATYEDIFFDSKPT